MRSQRYQQIFFNENKHWWYRGRRKLLSEVLKSRRNLKILDFGCGPGSTINSLKVFGEVTGVDIEPKAINFCKQKGIKNVKVIKENAILPFPSNSFDAISCMDVLEHIRDQSSTLQDLKRVLKPRGLLILTVPAYSFLWGELDERSHHLRRYTKGELVAILKKSGLKIQKAAYFSYLFFIPVAIIRVFQRSFMGRKNYWGVDPVVKSNFINKIITVIFEFDVISALKLNPPFGVSIVVIAKKD